MKTTVDIPKDLFRQLKDKAVREKTTMKSLIQAALRGYLASAKTPHKKFKLKDGSVGGRGIRPGLNESDWSAIRELAYEGRGA
jgi:hypothetical protein